MRMHLTAEDKSRIRSGSVSVVKEPDEGQVDEVRDPAVVAKVSEMLGAIERDGMDAVLRYARELDALRRQRPGGSRGRAREVG